MSTESEQMASTDTAIGGLSSAALGALFGNSSPFANQDFMKLIPFSQAFFQSPLQFNGNTPSKKTSPSVSPSQQQAEQYQKFLSNSLLNRPNSLLTTTHANDLQGFLLGRPIFQALSKLDPEGTNGNLLLSR